MLGCAKGPRLVEDPGSAIAKALPPGWVIGQTEENTWPTLGKHGKGTAFYLVESGKHYGKQQYSTIVCIMPRSYEYGDGPKGEYQVMPSRLAASCSNGKIYLWGCSEEMERLILDAIIRR
jgi:hypothetical protein